MLRRALHLTDQLSSVAPVLLRRQHPRPDQLGSDQIGGPVCGQPPRVHMGGHRLLSRIGVPERPAFGQQPVPLGRAGQAHHPPGDRGLPRARQPGDHVQARTARPYPRHNPVDLGGPPGEPGMLTSRRAAAGR